MAENQVLIFFHWLLWVFRIKMMYCFDWNMPINISHKSIVQGDMAVIQAFDGDLAAHSPTSDQELSGEYAYAMSAPGRCSHLLCFVPTDCCQCPHVCNPSNLQCCCGMLHFLAHLQHCWSAIVWWQVLQVCGSKRRTCWLHRYHQQDSVWSSWATGLSMEEFAHPLWQCYYWILGTFSSGKLQGINDTKDPQVCLTPEIPDFTHGPFIIHCASSSFWWWHSLS